MAADDTTVDTGGELERAIWCAALLTPDEVRRLPSDSQILFKAGASSIFARKLRYYTDPEFSGLFVAQWMIISSTGLSKTSRQMVAGAALQTPLPPTGQEARP
jgi:type IV secretory pathway TraG/TraD family ATPase VirD4